MSDKLRKGGAATAAAVQSSASANLSAANAFVKRNQDRLMSKGGKAPNLTEAELMFNSNMTVTGDFAKDVARTLTAGLNKEAYPVK